MKMKKLLKKFNKQANNLFEELSGSLFNRPENTLTLEDFQKVEQICMNAALNFQDKEQFNRVINWLRDQIRQQIEKKEK